MPAIYRLYSLEQKPCMGDFPASYVWLPKGRCLDVGTQESIYLGIKLLMEATSCPATGTTTTGCSEKSGFEEFKPLPTGKGPQLWDWIKKRLVQWVTAVLVDYPWVVHTGYTGVLVVQLEIMSPTLPCAGSCYVLVRSDSESPFFLLLLITYFKACRNNGEAIPWWEKIPLEPVPPTVPQSSSLTLGIAGLVLMVSCLETRNGTLVKRVDTAALGDTVRKPKLPIQLHFNANSTCVIISSILISNKSSTWVATICGWYPSTTPKDVIRCLRSPADMSLRPHLWLILLTTSQPDVNSSHPPMVIQDSQSERMNRCKKRIPGIIQGFEVVFIGI